MFYSPTESSVSTSTGGKRLEFESTFGPIFIQKLLCSSNSSDPFVECLNEVNLGLSDCYRERDNIADIIGIECEGMALIM